MASPGADLATKITYITLDWIRYIYMCSTMAMFCTLAWALVRKFSQINDQLNDLKEPDVDLRACSVRHSLVCQAVWQLEQYFQNIMLISISCIFVGAVNDSFFSYFYFGRGMYVKAAVFAWEVAYRFFWIDAVCYVAGRLKDEVKFDTNN